MSAVSSWLHPALSATELVGLFGHFVLLSLLSVGGAITVAPEMQRYTVVEHGWLTGAQFTASVAIAQAAPGPNVLFVAVIGWNVAGPAGMLATMLGILLPSTAMSIFIGRWGTRRRETRALRAFSTGVTPITIGLLLATGWVLSKPYLLDEHHRWGALGLIALTIAASLRTKVGPMWLVAIGAVAGVLGWV